jgi:uncharacterized membrane protein YkgB
VDPTCESIRGARRNKEEEDMGNGAVSTSEVAGAAGEQLAIPDIAAIGREVTRYGLVTVLLWIGAMKFTVYEAEAIQGLVANSPFLSWTYGVLSLRGVSALIGVSELAIAALIALGRWSPRAGMLGGGLAVGQFLTTLSFMLTTPGVFEPSIGGFPALSVIPGQFLIKDIVLLGASVWAFGEARNRLR